MFRLRALALLAMPVVAGCGLWGGSAGEADAGRLLGIVATCAAVAGDVQVRRVGEAFWEPALLGTTLREGDWLRTGPGSRSRIALVGGTSLRVDANSVVEIGLLRTGAGSRPVVALEAGTVQSHHAGAGTVSPPLAFRTPDGRLVDVVARPEGDEPATVDVSAAPGALHVTARQGSALISVDGSPAQGTPRGVSAEIGARGLRIEPLLPFPKSLSPSVDARQLCLAERPVALRWEPVAGARAYRVQVAADLSFDQLMVDEIVEGASQRVALPAREAAYAWRVATLDAAARPGEFGSARLVFCERSEPRDHLVSPDDGSVINAVKGKALVRLEWQPASPEATYRVVVASGVDLTRHALRVVKTSSTQVEVELGVGRYRWGVYRDGDVPAPLFNNAPRTFRVVGGAGAPRLKVPNSILALELSGAALGTTAITARSFSGRDDGPWAARELRGAAGRGCRRRTARPAPAVARR
ncbi:MAG: hypothetical protein QM765_05150 [Myxococcales bacterium]